MLTFTTIEQWRRWQHRQLGLARGIKARLARDVSDLSWFSAGSFDRMVDVAAAIDAATPSQAAAVGAPVTALLDRGATVAVVAPTALGELLGSMGLVHRRPVDLTVGVRSATSLSIGDHLPAGAALHAIACSPPDRCLVIQHGILTPWSPPPPMGTTVLSWSEADATFLLEGRPDLSADVVGSQLLFEAAREPRPLIIDPTPIFLGQLHGAELARSVTIATVEVLAGEGPLIYRPHPAEVDRRSRRQHHRWSKEGLVIDWSSTPLHELAHPVTGIFSTGLLEAAAVGLPATGTCASPEPWILDLWDRYGIATSSSESTKVGTPSVEPAAAIADLVEVLAR